MTLKKTYLILVVLFGFSSQLVAQDKEQKAIREVMRLQENAWNKGDLQGFMLGYWNSPELLFIGSRGATYGWETTLQNYQRSYPNTDAMGKLAFEILKVEITGKDSAWVVGKWALQREKDRPNGHFLLVWRKIKGKWLIVADHSS
ncbi:MAG: nuclear transport factor 2 family protein [Bacteroidetes bacterium]|nr:MAG: nuclear transport factor 2 family protein [Bacteroidota bacterium]